MIKGSHHTKETKVKMSDYAKEHNNAATLPILYGKDHPRWKGNDAKYHAIHTWVKRRKGNAKKCIECGSEKGVCWANKNHKYNRNVDDYIELCASCHKKYDIKNNGIIGGNHGYKFTDEDKKKISERTKIAMKRPEVRKKLMAVLEN